LPRSVRQVPSISGGAASAAALVVVAATAVVVVTSAVLAGAAVVVTSVVVAVVSEAGSPVAHAMVQKVNIRTANRRLVRVGWVNARLHFPV
jgi:hypothetical protein